MKSTTLIISLLSLFSATALAHPSNFSPNHAQLQKRCPPFDPAGVKNIGNGAGTQFIGGQCLSGADCASGCCANPCGICSGLGAQNQAGKTGCGFGGGGSANANTGAGTGTGSSDNNNANSNSNPNDDTGSGTGTGTGIGSQNTNGGGSSCNSA